jgi:preprotein translocase subunit SecA
MEFSTYLAIQMQTFVLPDIGTEIAIEEKLDKDAEAEEKKIISRFRNQKRAYPYIDTTLKAYALFEKDVEYVIMDNKIMIVDEQTGRIMDGRRYSDGLHQAIEAKENVKSKLLLKLLQRLLTKLFQNVQQTRRND